MKRVTYDVGWVDGKRTRIPAIIILKVKNIKTRMERIHILEQSKPKMWGGWMESRIWMIDESFKEWK